MTEQTATGMVERKLREDNAWEIQPAFNWFDEVFSDLDAELARLNPFRPVQSAVQRLILRGA